MIKTLVKYILKKKNLKVWPVTPKSLSGFDFYEDIRKIISIPNPLCFDVGASHGQTAEGWLKIFPDPIIYSFEPSTESFEILQSKHFAGDVHVTKMALGSQIAQREFINYDQPWLSSFLPLTNDVMPVFNNPVMTSQETVEVNTVDNLVLQHAIQKIHLLKSDTQGFDLEVLKGATQSLKSGLIDCVLIEINFMNLYEGQSSPFEIFEFLRNHDYYLIDLYEKIRIGFPVAWCNALFTRRPDKIS